MTTICRRLSRRPLSRRGQTVQIWTLVASYAALIALPSRNEARAYNAAYDVWMVYLADLGQGMWVPEVFVTGSAGAMALSTDVKILLDGANITGLSDTDPVTYWPNAGSSGDFAEATNPPEWKESSDLAGTPAVLSTGGSITMSMGGTLDLGQNIPKAMAAALHNPTTVNTTDRLLLHISTNASTSGKRFYFYYDTVDRLATRQADADTLKEGSDNANSTLPSAGVWNVFGALADYADTSISITAGETESAYGYAAAGNLGAAPGNTDNTVSAAVTILKSPVGADAADTLLKQLWYVTGTLATRINLATLMRYLEMMGGI